MSISTSSFMYLHISISKKKLYVFSKNTQNYSLNALLGEEQFPRQQLNKVLILQY